MKLEITKVYRTNMTVNMATHYVQNYDLSKVQDLILSEAVSSNEKQGNSIKVEDPKSFKIQVSKYADKQISIKPNGQTNLVWYKFDEKGLAIGKPQGFDNPIQLKDGETMEISRALESEPPFYTVSFRFHLIQH